MMSAYNFFNPDPRGLQTGLPPQEMVRRAQSRLMQADIKPPEVDAYLQHIIETGGRPTMEAPNMMSKLSSAQPLMGVLPGGEMVAGQPGPGFGLPSGNGPGGVTLRPGAPSPISGFQGVETVGLGGLQLGMAPTGTVQTQEPDYMQSALNYFGDTYDTFNANTGMSSTPMTPELLVQRAQGRLAQRDVKPPEVQAYLQNVVETGGNPTMLAPDMSNNFTNLAASPLSGFQGVKTVGLGGLQLARTQFG
jgi:hypothetical protein